MDNFDQDPQSSASVGQSNDNRQDAEEGSLHIDLDQSDGGKAKPWPPGVSAAGEDRDGMMISDAEGVILRVNQIFFAITGYTAEEAVGRKTDLLRSGRHGADFYAAMRESLHRQGTWKGEVWARRKNGEVFPGLFTITATKGFAGDVTHYVCTFRDTSMGKERPQQQTEEQAYYDPLTGLPNRRLMRDRLKQALAATARHQRGGALLFVDLDNFRTVNDSHGYDRGDLLLREVARRLSVALREADTVARIGGDEFAVVLTDLSGNVEASSVRAKTVGRKILSTLGELYLISGEKIHCTPSIGITLFGDQRVSDDKLMAQADIAMYQAKAAGRNTLRFFDPKTQEAMKARVDMEEGLLQGIRNNQFVLHYQPKVCVKTRAVIGYEALLRWNSPTLGMVPPAQFIPIAEDSGLIVDIGNWVIDEACRQIAAWHAAGYGFREVAVNVSALQLKSGRLAEQIAEACSRHGIPASALEAELTESVVMSDPHQAKEIFQKLRISGIRLTVDDFGTGYSCLAHLRRLPIDVLKIDRSFVMDADRDEDAVEIVRTIMALAKTLNLDVVAEGVETESQAQLLEEAGCDIFQGYLFSKPLPVNDIDQMLREETKPMLRKIKRAMIVEDSAQMRELIHMALDCFGAEEIINAGNGAEAIACLEDSGADIVIMDWRMDVMDGLECTQRIRAGIPGVDPTIPIILLTGFAGKAAESAAYDAGVDHFMKKPFSLRTLHSALEKVLTRSGPVLVRRPQMFGHREARYEEAVQ
ncbi:MAG TPA: EAL domain-containing protein [Rhodospirillaceae bacterium]|nr:EAL domain-containing protein [Rhodospirillaceae bacterium]